MKKFFYSDSHKSKDYGVNYDSTIYKRGTYDSKVWELEKIILKNILSQRKDAKTLDFACGTGRITKFFEEINLTKLYGIDNSDEMLNVAKKRLSHTILLNSDITTDKLSMPFDKFETIVSFRFFLNADRGLSLSILKSINTLLDKDGIFIFNIHGNKKSIRYLQVIIRNFFKKITATLFNRKNDPFRYKKQLSIKEVKRMLKSCGFEICEIYSYSYIPSYITDVMPYKVWKDIEKRLINISNQNGTHLMFVAKKIT